MNINRFLRIAALLVFTLSATNTHAKLSLDDRLSQNEKVMRALMYKIQSHEDPKKRVELISEHMKPMSIYLDDLGNKLKTDLNPKEQAKVVQLYSGSILTSIQLVQKSVGEEDFSNNSIEQRLGLLNMRMHYLMILMQNAHELNNHS